MSRNAALSPRLFLGCVFGLALMLTTIACETARGGSSIVAATDEAQKSKAWSQSRSQAQSRSAEPNSPEAAAAAMWQKITSTCPVPGSAKPALFYEETVRPMDGTRGLADSVRFFEFRDAWTMYRPTSISEADGLNGIQSAGTVFLGFSAYREFDLHKDSGYGWYPFQPGNNRTEIEAIRDHYNWSWSLQKRNGKWSISGLWGSVLDPDSIAAHKRSCAALAGADPFAPNKD